MTVYLVDFENVRSEGLKGVEELTSEDKVVIFYSKNADAITFDVHTLLSKSPAEIETYRILRGGHYQRIWGIWSWRIHLRKSL